MRPKASHCGRPANLVGWLAGLVAVGLINGLYADVIRLKDGMTLIGLSAKDGTLVDVFDPEGLKQTVLRDSKIAENRSEPAPAKPLGTA